MKSSAQTLQRSLKFRGHAAAMRQHGTASERALWALLSGCKLGVWFRQQVVVQGSIVDLAAASARLIVEVDGQYHTAPARQRADARRDRRLGKAGWRVLRLSAELVVNQPDMARQLVLVLSPKGGSVGAGAPELSARRVVVLSIGKELAAACRRAGQARRSYQIDAGRASAAS